MELFPKIKPMGERSILLEFEPEITEQLLRKVLTVKRFIKEELLKETVEVTNTYNSLLITYASPIEDVYSEVLRLQKEIKQANKTFHFESHLFHIPVCYEEHFALDLQEICAAKNMLKEEIIRLHSSVNYLVFFTGFLPGFLYLGGLPKELHFSRRKHPRAQVEKGAVGIGEKQTGIYPQASPGGWNIIGNSPVPLFDAFANPPCVITAGDKVKFCPISLDEHREISRQVEEGNYSFKIETS